MQQIPDFSHTRILVIGDVMLDRYWHGGTHRISPEAPVPVVQVQEAEERPGGAANVALNIAALGGKVSLIGIVGDDANGKQLSAKCEQANVDCHFVVDTNADTITKLRVLSLHQQLIRLDFESKFSSEISEQVLQFTEQLIADVDAIILSDYGKGSLLTSKAIIQLARQYRKPVFVDPKGRDFSLYQGATFITPNRKEFEEVVGLVHSEEEFLQQGLQLIAQCQLDYLLVTRGAQGMTLISPARGEIHLPAVALEVYDVTGAGDTVISVLALAYVAGCDVEMAVALANHAAGIVVAKLGTATVNLPELRRAYLAHRAPSNGIMTEDQLAIAVADAKAHGERVVMTNGCFDILHAGHISYLENAKALGDRLIIAVNDDASVQHLKGPGRPINTLANRMAVLAGLNAVDWIVSFSEDTPARLIDHILPDVLVKGGDYTDPSKIAGYESVVANGGEVKILNFVEGCSTSAVIQKIQREEMA